MKSTRDWFGPRETPAKSARSDEDRAAHAEERARIEQDRKERAAREREAQLIADTRLAWRVALQALGEEGLHANANTQPYESTIATIAAGVLARMGSR